MALDSNATVAQAQAVESMDSNDTGGVSDGGGTVSDSSPSAGNGVSGGGGGGGGGGNRTRNGKPMKRKHTADDSNKLNNGKICLNILCFFASTCFSFFFFII